MRVVLLYPPPWKIPAPGEAPDPVDGPPDGYREGDLDGDFFQLPYGLLSLGAEAIRAGHQVKVLNLSAFPWARVLDVLERTEADVWGMSCWTANRRGVGLVAKELARRWPTAHVVVGGPHATPLAKEMLDHHPEIHTVCTGESDVTFVELLARLEAKRSLVGLPGAWIRVNGVPQKGPARANVSELDTLADPHDYFDTHIVMTSRGCPWQCTFCGADTTWGRGFRGHSVPYVIDMLAKAVARAPVKMLQIKDDTFTANKKRALSIARGIRERGLSFLWSCDTRVDVLDEAMLREMRLAGCERLSLGVESGSAKILEAIHKKITKDEILAATRMAKRVGIKLRFYMMLGNRGETAETFRETLAFLEEARPHSYLFSCLSIYPGTVDFHDAEAAGWLRREEYFEGTFQELKVPFDASEDDARLLADWFEKNRGVRTLHRESADECRATLAHLGEHHAARVDLAGALFQEGAHAEAEEHLTRALELGYPLPGLVHNYRACIAAVRRDLRGLETHLGEALRSDPQHPVVQHNARVVRAWLAQGGPTSGASLPMVARHDFELLQRPTQPTLPGPLRTDFAAWTEAATVQRRPAPADERRRLTVVGSA